MGHQSSSVYRVTPRSLALALAALCVVLLPAVFAPHLIRKSRRRRGYGVNALDQFAIGQSSPRAEWLGNLGTIVGIATPFAVDWVDTRGEKDVWFEDAVVVGQALALNGALNTIVKYAVQRPLPETYAGWVRNRRGKPRGYRAFYSGHVSSLATSLAAACITVRLRHGKRPWRWPWIVSAMASCLVGIGRIFSGKHFPTDILAAAPVGAALGIAVPLLHARKSSASRSRRADTN
jgi:membrane-associated phospholipid phosphatase